MILRHEIGLKDDEWKWDPARVQGLVMLMHNNVMGLIAIAHVNRDESIMADITSCPIELEHIFHTY